MAQQTSVETIEEQIEHEMSKLEMDFNNGVEWSMRIFFASLKQIRNKVWEAKKMHKAEIKNAFNEGNLSAYNNNRITNADKYYNETFKQ